MREKYLAKQVKEMQQLIAKMQQRTGDATLQQQELQTIGAIFDKFSTILAETLEFQDQLHQQNEELLVAERSLKAQESETRQNQIINILETITDAFFALDNEWRFTYLNRQAEILLQRTRQDLLGKSVWNEFPKAGVSKFYREYRKAASKHVSITFEKFYPALNTWFEVHVYPSKHGVSVYLNNINQRKHLEEGFLLLQTISKAVFESKDFHTALRILLEKICESTHWDFSEAWIPRPDGSVLECSPAWYSRTDTLKAFRTESESVTFAKGVGIPGRVWQSKQAEWRRDVSSESVEIYLRTDLATESGLKSALGIPIIANGQVIAVLVFYMFESRNEDRQLIDLISASAELGLFIQRKQAEEEINKSLEKEKELSELKNHFVSMTSHEFRTPLSTILLSAGLLEKYGFKWAPDKNIQHLQRIQTSVQQMSRLLDDVLLIGKAEAAKLEFNPTRLNLNEFCREMVEEIQLTHCQKHEIKFVNHGESVLTFMDEKLLWQILTNLLSNAAKYSPDNSTISFEIWEREEKVIFQIQDRGIGIPKEDRQHLFESFYRATNVGKISGTGLGLAIVKKSVEIHGGEIAVESEVGVGTTFTVKLPLNKLQV